MGASGERWVPVGDSRDDAVGPAIYPFSGEYEHSVDDKGRVTLPARLRDAFEGAVYLARGLDGCLCLYSEEKWHSLSKQASGLSLTDRSARFYSRMIYSATRCEIDKAGRILIPLGLRKFAGIANQLTMVGVEDRMELWAPEQWEGAMSVLRNAESSSLAAGWEALRL